MRRSKRARTAGQARGQIIDAVSIRERPAAVENRAVPGHWEGPVAAGHQADVDRDDSQRRRPAPLWPVATVRGGGLRVSDQRGVSEGARHACRS